MSTTTIHPTDSKPTTVAPKKIDMKITRDSEKPSVLLVRIKDSDYYYEIQTESKSIFKYQYGDDSKPDGIVWELSWENDVPTLYVHGALGIETWRHYPHAFARELDLYKDCFNNKSTVTKIESFWRRKLSVFGFTFYPHEAKKVSKAGWLYQSDTLSKDGVVYVTFDQEQNSVGTRSRVKGNQTVALPPLDTKWCMIRATDETMQSTLSKDPSWAAVVEEWKVEL